MHGIGAPFKCKHCHATFKSRAARGVHQRSKCEKNTKTMTPHSELSLFPQVEKTTETITPSDLPLFPQFEKTTETTPL